MEFSLRALEQLIAVVEDGSFTRAAERLNVAQPWLSARIRRLEEIAGFQLLDRSTRQIRPTSEGELFLAQARAVVREARQLARVAYEVARGASALRIGAAPYTYFLPERQAIIEGFANANRGIEVEIENGQDPQLRRAVLHGELDASIVTGAAPPGCESLVVRPHPLVLMIPVEHPLASLDAVPLIALEGVAVAAWRRSANPVAWDQTVGYLADAGARIVSLPEPMRRAQIDAARRDRAILAALGRLPDDAAATGDADEIDALLVRPLAEPRLRADITLIRRISDRRRPALDQFWSFARAMTVERAVVDQAC